MTMTAGVKIPMLGYSAPDTDAYDPDSAALIVGTRGLTLDGAEFPWPTVGDWDVKFAEDGLATLTVHIAVTLPRDPDAA